MVLAAAPAGPVRAAPARELVVCDDVTEPPTLDPQKEFVEKNHTIVQQVYEGLVRFAPDGRIVPALATSWERISPTEIRFRLRPNVRFHNGEPFDADAVRFSIRRYLDPRTGFPALGFIQTLKGARVEDPLTVTIETHGPDGLLLNRLAGVILIVPPGYMATQGANVLDRHPVGTGPFRFESWTPGKEIRFAANSDYWDPGIPAAGGLVFRFLDPDAQINRLLSGDIDIVTEVPGTSTLTIQKSGVARIVKQRTLFTVAASFNVTDGPLSDPRVRRALNYAVDKAALVRYDLMGNGAPINSLVLSDQPGQAVNASLNRYAFDPAKARALLEQSGYGKGFRLRLIEVKATRAARIIAAYWKRIGVETDVVSSADATIGPDIRSGKWDVFLGACPDPMHDPYFIHSIFLHSKSPYSLTRDERLDDLIEALVLTTDPSEREARIAALAAFVNGNAYSLFTYERIKTYGVKKGVEFHPYISGMPHFRDAGFSGGTP